MIANERLVKDSPASGRRNRDLAVMDVAISVMSARGYTATPVQEIADRVGVLKGSLYHYFSSKEELLFRILEEAHQEADRISAEVSALDLSPYDELMEFLRREAVWLLENIERANIYWTEARHLTGERRKQFARYASGFSAHVTGLLERAITEGTVRDDIELRILTAHVIGALNSVRSWPANIGSPGSREGIAPEALAADCATLLGAALQPR